MGKKIILISGTPTTGKTSVANELNKLYKYYVFSLSEIVISKNLYSEVDEERDTKVIDEIKLQDYILSQINQLDENTEYIIIEGHYADIIDHPNIISGIVLRCHPEILEKRLEERKYSKKKIMENLNAELVGDSASFMLEKQAELGKDIFFEIDVTDQTIEEMATLINSIIYSPQDHKEFQLGKISWLSDKTVSIERYLD
jgi:adenylate kinase